MPITLVHQTKAEFSARFWSRLKAAHLAGDKVEYSRLIWWIYQRITAGDLTSNEVRLSFNAAYGRSLTVAQWSALASTRFAPARDRYQAMLDEEAL